LGGIVEVLSSFALLFGHHLGGIMRFHLCGGLDAPDWILANIVTLSTIVSASDRAFAFDKNSEAISFSLSVAIVLGVNTGTMWNSFVRHAFVDPFEFESPSIASEYSMSSMRVAKARV
jgi:hypothetical protein